MFKSFQIVLIWKLKTYVGSKEYADFRAYCCESNAQIYIMYRT